MKGDIWEGDLNLSGAKKMEKINEIVGIDFDFASDARDLKEKVNELVRAVNSLKCVEKEQTIYELLSPHDVLIISKSDGGLLTAANDGNGRVLLERVPWPKEEEEKK